MTLVLDASSALAWLLKRTNLDEARVAREALDAVRAMGAVVPALWYAEVANTLLFAERQRVITSLQVEEYLSSLSIWKIMRDPIPPEVYWGQVVSLGRVYSLTAYDATYLELALRTGRTLATFDAKLAGAMRQAGGRVFGDAE